MFTAYMIPALIVPVIWLVRWIGRRWLGRRPASGLDLGRIVGLNYTLVLAWVLVWSAVLLGLPIEKGGSLTAVLCWVVYGLSNVVLALLLLQFTTEYGSLPPGEAADRLFVRFLGAIIAQPIVTTLAFSVLYRVTGVAWQLHVPGVPAVQEGM